MIATHPAPLRVRPLSSVQNALRILQAFNPDDPVLGVSEIARRLQLPKSTTSRLLATLEAEGFVEKLENGRFRLGLRLHDLGTLAADRLNIRKEAQDAMLRLHGATGDIVQFSVLEELEVVYLMRIESENIRSIFGNRWRMPAHMTTSGKVLLAYAKPKVLERLAAGLAADRPAARKLSLTLEKIRTNGFHVDYDGCGKLASVGVPVFDRTGAAVAAIAVTGIRDEENRQSLWKNLPLLRETATSIAYYFKNPEEAAAVADRDIRQEYLALHL